MTARSKKLSAGDKARLISPVVIYVVLAVAAWKLGYFRAQKVTAEAASAADSAWMSAIYVLIYGAIAALALPVGPLAYAAGAIFGFIRGSIIVWIASMIGATAGYWLARDIWAKPARRLLGRYTDKLRGLRKGNVFLAAFRMQLTPIIPFGVLNYAAAISKLSPSRFFAGTALGIIPGTLLATFVGDRVITGVHGGGKEPFLVAGSLLLLLLALSFAPKLWQRLKKRRD